MAKPFFDRVALVGLGLIGSSLAYAMKRGGLAGHIAGHARSAATRDRAMELGFLDSVHTTPEDAVKEADLVILCVPIGVNASIAKAIAPALKPGAILTDVGSVKAAVIRDIAPHVPDGVHFIPGHPVAGTERSGPDAGFAELFDERWCILTPLENTDAKAVQTLTRFWVAVGSRVDMMDPKRHDLVLAITSHLPQLIAYNIVSTANHLETVTETDVIKYSAGGFRDFTRLAASDPVMWRDIFLNNKDAALEMLARFSEDLTDLQRAIRYGDGDALFKVFTETRRIRREVIEAGEDTAVDNFGRQASKDGSE